MFVPPLTIIYRLEFTVLYQDKVLVIDIKTNDSLLKTHLNKITDKEQLIFYLDIR